MGWIVSGDADVLGVYLTVAVVVDQGAIEEVVWVVAGPTNVLGIDRGVGGRVAASPAALPTVNRRRNPSLKLAEIASAEIQKV